jgi:hypothetical protein
MSNLLRRLPVTYLAYVCLLLGFVALGCFVYALAAGSAYAVLIGAALVLSFAAAVAGFRIGDRPAVRDGEIDRYLQTYRGSSSDDRVLALRREPALAGVQRAA